MNRENNLRTPILFASIMAIGMFLGYQMNKSLRYNDKSSSNDNGNLAEIMKLVNAKYVDKVNTDSIEMKAIDNLLNQLDPHSVYIPPSELQSVNEDMDGEFEGIGVEYYIQKDTILITSVLANGPSQAAGLLNGDKLIRVDDSLVAGVKINSERISKLLRGPGDSKVDVQILRLGKVLKPIAIVRGIIPMHSIDAAYMLDASNGYIKINRFSATTYDEFVKKLIILKGQGLKNLVIDLRDNPGGYLDAAVNIADELLPGKKTIVYTRGRIKEDENYVAEATGHFETGQLAILVDEGSASAAEILSGALQDFDRATIIGRRTYGKGLVQEQYPLSNGGALRLTIARYYIPSGRCIQKDYSHGINNYEADVLNRYKKGELYSKDSILFKDTTIYKTMSGRRVYGGGGIMPDIFVPIEADKYSQSLRNLIVNTSLANDVANDYYLANMTTLKNYKTVAEYNNQFQIDETILNTLKAKCIADSVDVSSFSNANDIAFLKKRIKAQIAKSVFNQEAQFIIINNNDNCIKQALQSFIK
jgi:carboxyl-terminal processing protease